MVSAKMDSNGGKQSSTFAGAASLDVSRLDKTHALASKEKDNVLMSGLCQEDKLYLRSLMDDDSSDEDDGEIVRSSAWSPMIHSPVITNKRIRKLRPSYAITLSLEDISYIRPSWGMSKGLKTIRKREPKKLATEQLQKQHKRDEISSGSHEAAYRWFLVLLTIVVLALTVPTYLFGQKKFHDKSMLNRLFVDPKSRILDIYKTTGEQSILKVHFGDGIPRDLKPNMCTCAIYNEETRRYNPTSGDMEDKKNCFACLDWAYRVNLRVYTSDRLKQQSSDNSSFCYDIKWHSYDTLQTPLVDCFEVKDDEQWFGLGDIHWPIWQLNKRQFGSTPLVSNLSAEFLDQDDKVDVVNHLALGSYVNFSLFSTTGIYIGKIRTDFQVSLSLSQDSKSGKKRICLSAACTDKCTQTWSRIHHLEQLRYHNNYLEYRICSADSLKSLITKQFVEKTSLGLTVTATSKPSPVEIIADTGISGSISAKVVESETIIARVQSGTEPVKDSVVNTTSETKDSASRERDLPESLGLIERTIFTTSSEFLPVLDGQTIRQYVDDIVMLGLKASPILLIDPRWETHVGSLELNTALFPKAKLLFEILHNKGFKIVLTIKPYIDSIIGTTNINQLFENGRLYSANFKKGNFVWPSFGAPYRKVVSHGQRGTIIRRKSLFTHVNESIEIGQKDSVRIPYICRCKESQEGYCALIDLTQAQNRAWMIDNIMQSSLLTKDADGILIGGAHPSGFQWDDHYRRGVSELAKSLLIKRKVYTIPQWTGDFSYIQLAPRQFSWDGLRSILGSILNLEMNGFSLVHPGSVWGDMKSTNSPAKASTKSAQDRINIIYGSDGMQSSEKSDEELAIRWLQVSIFLPILQFSNIAPIKQYELQEMVQNLTRIRKLYLVPELKKHLPYTQLISSSRIQLSLSKTNISSGQNQFMPLIRPVWLSDENGDTIVPDQFSVGPDLLVAPILGDNIRQRDIYLPSGFWRDELRQINIRGGKWLRNYPVELNEIAWLTRAKR